MSGRLKKIRNIILMYHGIGDPGAADGVADAIDPVYTIDEAIFLRHIELIVESGLPVVLPGETPGVSSTEGSGSEHGPRLMITFDDGYRSDHAIALPHLLDNGLKATFFITTGWTGRPGYMDRSMIREISDAGMTIGSHGVSHAYMTDLSDSRLKAELEDSRKALEDMAGNPVYSFSAPGGRLDKRVSSAALEAGYRHIFSSEPSVNGPLTGSCPAGRFAVTTGRTEDWLRLILAGRPPLGEKIKYGSLSLLKKAFGNRLYESIRKTVLRE